MQRYLYAFLLVIFLCCNYSAMAQCPMCKGSAETSLKQGRKDAIGLNKGILYMFAGPYLIVGSIAALWLYNKRKVERQYKEAQENFTASQN